MHKQHEILIANMRILRWGPNATFIPPAQVWGLALGEFLDTNMLLSPTQSYGIEGLSQREDPTRMVLRCSGI